MFKVIQKNQRFCSYGVSVVIVQQAQHFYVGLFINSILNWFTILKFKDITLLMELHGETNKIKTAQVLLLCLQHGVPPGFNHTLDDIRKRMKFENEDDIKRLRSCIDLIEDTEYAIIEFCEYQLSRDRRERNYGEIYLRLYGTLNAIYLQMQATVEIAEIVKMPNKKEIISKLASHKAIEVRNMLGAHTVNYMHPDDSRTNYFRITQVDLRADASKLTIVGKNHYEELNLRETIAGFSNALEVALLEILNKYINTLFKSDKHNRDIFQKAIDNMLSSPTKYDVMDIATEKELKKLNDIIAKAKKHFDLSDI